MKTVAQAQCMKCGHEWLPIVDDPKVCPRCKSYSWRERRKQPAG